MGIIEELIYFIAQFLAAAIVLSFHEFAHAYAAHKCGDDTARLAGRLTLNPMVHFDLWGIIMFALAGFGWAKPVPVNPRNFRDFKKGSFWTSIAGVLMNLCMAFLIYPIFLLVMRFIIPLVSGMYLGYFLYYFFNMLFEVCL